MTKKELKTELISFAKNSRFMTTRQTAEFLGVSEDTARRMLADVSYIQLSGRRGRRYLVTDVAEAINERRMQ